MKCSMSICIGTCSVIIESPFHLKLGEKCILQYIVIAQKMNISCIQKTCWVFFQADFTSIKFT